MTDIVNPISPPVVPPVPQRNDEATFEDRSDAGWEFAFNTLPGYMQDTMDNVHQNAVATNERALAADQRATDAETAKGLAEDARDKAEEWAEGVEPAPGSKSAKKWAGEAEDAKDSAWAAAAAAGVSAGLPQPLVPGKVLGVTPDGLAAWIDGAALRRIERAANVQIGKGEVGRIVDIVGGSSFTQTFEPSADLGDGWWCYLKNSGTGDITLDPAGSETIDGLTSYIMYPGEVRLIQCDGLALRSVVINAFKRVYTESGSFVKPSGYTGFDIEAIGGGASGGTINPSYKHNGGSGGGRAREIVSSDQLSQVESVLVGAGGIFSTTASAGGNSGIDGIVLATGGSVGVYQTAGSTNYQVPGRGGYPNWAKSPNGGYTSTNTGQLILNTMFGGGFFATTHSRVDSIYGGGAGGYFAHITSNNTFQNATGGDSVYGGGGGGAGYGLISNEVFGQPGGVSTYAGSGGNGATTSGGNGENGQVPGGGGGGGGGTPGNGARGEVRILGVI